MTLYPIILSGGSGTRLWPLSRASRPKQLLPLLSEHTMLQETVQRLQSVNDVAAPSIVCNNEHRFLVAEQLRALEVKPHMLMLEPMGRNTAPAVAAAALGLVERDADALMLVLPADHVINDVAAFHTAIESARQVARDGYLVTFGIQPRHAETGYGYIQRGDALTGGHKSDGDAASNPAYKVARFVEKPDIATAGKYLESGEYFWNSGMFLFSAKLYLEELEKYSPQILSATRDAVESAFPDLDFVRLPQEKWAKSPSDSIDYAVMEKTSRAAVLPVDIGWSDVGSFSALWEVDARDDNGNVRRGNTLLHDVNNCYISGENSIVAVVGVDDLIVVQTSDAVLVAHKGHDQDVKKIVERLQQEGRSEHEFHRKVYRPWGSYEGVDRGERFQVKRLIVKPGEKSSMQRHHHRSEHWVVVSGTAEVTLDGAAHLISENESIYIPLGANHRIHNPGRIPLHLVEVQSGPYLGEDDIVRTDDQYGRVEE